MFCRADGRHLSRELLQVFLIQTKRLNIQRQLHIQGIFGRCGRRGSFTHAGGLVVGGDVGARAFYLFVGESGDGEEFLEEEV
jgi:hypothetical protein